jgi:hypothetical protein
MAEYIVKYTMTMSKSGKTERYDKVGEVVRCKDCKHWNGETHGCEMHSSVEPWWETDFCNYGERKDDPQTYTINAGEV